MNGAAHKAPIWIQLLLTLVSLMLGFFLFVGLAIGDCVPIPDAATAQACLAEKRFSFAVYPLLFATALIGAQFLRRKGGAWSLVLTILAGPLAIVLTLIAESAAI